VRRVVLFDLDETLVQEVAPVLDALRATCEVAGLHGGVDALALAVSLRETARRLWEAAPTHAEARALGISSWEGLRSSFPGEHPLLQRLRAWAPEYRHQVWSSALAEHGLADPSLVDLLAERFPHERLKRHAVYADAEPALRRLRERGMRLGLVTNGPSDLQRQKIAASGLAAYFETVVISGEVGVGKPDPTIFDVALGALSVQPDQAVMVGDTLGRDVAGARAAGIMAVWLNRRQSTRQPDQPEPDQEITTLADLP
jgi:phosphoserine phosphatase